MRTIRNLLAVMMTVFVLAGCTSLGGKKEAAGEGQAAVEDRGMAAGEAVEEGAAAQGLGAGDEFAGMSLDDPASPLAQRTIYFAFDSAEVTDEGRQIIETHAKYLAAHPEAKVVLEGHTDERGSREYNIGLGERRAQAVRRMMEFLGALPQQITTLSYGEEKPAVEGHDEEAWAKNRRVEIIYQ